jgi:hybrid cluster-associated redox disulfide protein
MKTKNKKTKSSSKSVKILKNKNKKKIALAPILAVTKNMTFGEILNRYPEAGRIIMSKGLHCIGCGMAFQETLEQGAIMHGINPDKLVKEINKKIGKKK